jgi:sensor histidine kinase YesM
LAQFVARCVALLWRPTDNRSRHKRWLQGAAGDSTRGWTMDNQTAAQAIPPAAPTTPEARSRHPLEIIPIFGRFRPGRVRNLIYTLIWNSLFALFFVLLSRLFQPEAPILHTLWVCLLIANCIGFLIHGSFALGRRLLGGWMCRQSTTVISVYYAVVSVACVFAGYWIAFTILEWYDARRYMFSMQGAITIVLLSIFISAILSSIFILRERRARADAAFQAERARSEAAQRQVQMARFKLLEAQVEPHFLYNTLANVISMIDAEPATAKRMLERLIDYLRGTAVAAGIGEATLGGQLALLRAYLDLIVLRLGSRLSYRIDVAPELEAMTLPPMLLQPLVENAIKHGLEPKVGGGEVVVRARRRAGEIVLTVSDDGLGVTGAGPTASTGIGLSNLRDRLATLYGSRARLTLEDGGPGTRVTLTLPADR